MRSNCWSLPRSRRVGLFKNVCVVLTQPHRAWTFFACLGQQVPTSCFVSIAVQTGFGVTDYDTSPESKWTHEMGSEMMFDALCSEYDIDLTSDEQDFIKDLIRGRPNLSSGR